MEAGAPQETILLADDEPIVLGLAKTILDVYKRQADGYLVHSRAPQAFPRDSEAPGRALQCEGLGIAREGLAGDERS